MAAQQLDLSGIKDHLTARRAMLEQRHRKVELDLQRRFDPLVADSSDRAIQLQNDQTLQAIDDATREELAAVIESLQRLEQGLYGICKVCGAQIEPGRLKALHAVTCVKCASG